MKSNCIYTDYCIYTYLLVASASVEDTGVDVDPMAGDIDHHAKAHNCCSIYILLLSYNKMEI